MTANGKSWTYSYALSGSSIDPALNASNFELAKVTRPDGTEWKYEYPTFSDSAFTIARGYLGQITYPEGGRNSYTYDYVPTGIGFPAVLLRITKKTSYNNSYTSALAAPTWTYRYRFWESVNGSSIGVSTTDVEDPAGGLTTYKHETPYASSIAKAWRIGLLLEKMNCAAGYVFGGGSVSTCDPATAINREQNEWGSQLVPSVDPYFASTALELNYSDAQLNRPLLIKKTITRDGATYVTQYQSHDTYGNPARVVETGNGITRTTDLTYYNDPVKWIVGQPKKETTDSLWVTDRSFDANGNVLSVVKNGVPTTFTYYTTGDLASVTDARLNRTDYSNYYRGVPRLESQPGGVSIIRTVNATGTLASETNGEGKLTQYTYDGLNRLAGVTPPVGNPTAIQWTSTEKRVTRGNFEEVSWFDGFGRVVDITKRDKISGVFTRLAYQYDALGQKVREAYPTTSTGAITGLPGIQYTYDPLGRLTKLTHADLKTQQFQYLLGNQVKLTNENAKIYTYTYRSYGNPDDRLLMTVVAPDPAANLTMTRNALGQVTSMVQAGVTRTLQYDSKGFLNTVNHPETGLITYGRDAVGNPTSKSVGVSPNVRTINYVYDSRNRLTNTTFQDATTPPVTLTYNQVDDVVNASRGTVTRTYDYDGNRNLTAESLLTDGRTFSLGYLYDGNDAISQVTYPDGQSVNYYPDALGRPTAVSPYVTGVAYHPSGQVSSMSYTNGVTTTQSFNSRQWPGQMSVSSPTTTLINTAYLYDGLGNVSSMTDSVSPTYNRTLGYDAIDRLTSVTGPWGAGSITYDGRGNIQSQNYGPTYSRSYVYDTANRLASYTGSAAFTYDAWGNATRSGNALSYHLFDDASNLYCASCDSASPTLFGYDANNYRVKKTRNAVATYSLYAKDGNLMMEYTPSTGDLKQFAYHNKKQVAMRHIVNPALILGQGGQAQASQLAVAIPRQPATFESDFLAGLLTPTPLLSLALTASLN